MRFTMNIRQPMRVLLADDDLLIHKLYGRSLARADFEVCNAEKGREVLEVACLKIRLSSFWTLTFRT
jgi:ActR/RegA family two-component response regulator